MTCSANGMGKREVKFILSRKNLPSKGSTGKITVRKGKFLCRNSAAPQVKLKENTTLSFYSSKWGFGSSEWLYRFILKKLFGDKSSYSLCNFKCLL